jgi:hypothetical protein
VTPQTLSLHNLPYLCTLMFKKELDPEDFYYSPEGYIVFTEKYHLKRGYCCKSGCRHCPYGYNKKTGLFDKPKQGG